jgi:hypothetical protein
LHCAGCLRLARTQSEVNLSGYPREFKQGHADGCASSRGPLTRNDQRFNSDAQYASGWRDGFDICRRTA